MSIPNLSAPQLRFTTAFAAIEIACDEDFIFSVRYLPVRKKALAPQNMLAAECARQVEAYFKKPKGHRFSLPLLPAKTAYQQRVREVMQNLSGGETLTYGEVAKQLGNSSPRAVGGACRANEIAFFVPCHRIVGATGLGGFMGNAGKHVLSIKQKLLQLEGAL
ncbi:MAG: methylated-DNA--[protein]-cysteine S-methyltransferase [Proteobacteria bacterium]|nr:methylated-DNA--[protein]-cysteine S-methyltransferase [Pseudomonadota bacterium]MCH9758708.1 methylated-DNA--[protein]-cysteine S-methyltransferase [Pseudomonadota bacterium]